MPCRGEDCVWTLLAFLLVGLLVLALALECGGRDEVCPSCPADCGCDGGADCYCKGETGLDRYLRTLP